MMKMWSAFGLAVVMLLAQPNAGDAAVKVLNLQSDRNGSIINGTDPFPGANQIRGSITFDDSTPGSGSGGTLYPGAATSASFSVFDGNNTQIGSFSSTTPGSITMGANVSNIDSIVFTFAGNIAVPGFPAWNEFEVDFFAPGGAVLPDEQLSNITTAVLQSMGYRATIRDPSTVSFYNFDDNVQLDVVPLPAALPLMLSGLAGLAFMRRWRRKAI